MFGVGLREHMRECLEARKETNRRIDDLDRKMEAGFGEARRKIDERHDQNQAAIKETRDESLAAIGKLYSGLWRVALWIITALTASYLAQHGLTAPGFGIPHH